MVLTPDVEEEIYDLWCPCLLMVKHRFSFTKCKLYSSSGSTSCQTCHYSPPLGKTIDPLTEFIRTVRENRTYEQIKQQEVIMGTAKVKGICSKCEEERVLPAHGKCFACNYGANKNLTKAEVMVKKNTAVIIKPMTKTLFMDAIPDGIKIIEDPNLVEWKQEQKTVQRTFQERWIDPILHPITIPFEPWIKTEEITVETANPSRKILKTWDGILIMHPSLRREVEEKIKGLG
jgi:hypothetical protein